MTAIDPGDYHDVMLELHVPSFGKADQVIAEAIRDVCRTMHTVFGPECQVVHDGTAYRWNVERGTGKGTAVVVDG